jgi:alpha-1,6-mannosyltransferase
VKLRAFLPEWHAPSVTNTVLIALGALMLGFSIIAIREPRHYVMSFNSVLLVQSILYLFACWIILVGKTGKSTLVLIIFFAVVFRLALVFTVPRFSTDIYRYVWDGRVQGSGTNPYRYVPADRSLSGLRDAAIYPNINRRDYARTIYPPAAEGIFFAITRVSESVTWMKAAITGFEALTIWAIVMLLSQLGMPKERALLYAWHPLVIWEFSGEGHIDAAAIAFIALALWTRSRRFQALTGLALGCATLVKFFPVILFPALYKRWGWKMPAAFIATIALGYLPYLSVGSRVLGFLPGYANEEGLVSGSRFFLLSLLHRLGYSMPANLFIAISAAALLAIGIWSLWKPERDTLSYARRCLLIATVFTALLTPHYVWYFAWLVPFLCFVPSIPVLLLTLTCSFLFGALDGSWFGTPDEMFRINLFVYVPAALLAMADVLRQNFGNHKAHRMRAS